MAIISAHLGRVVITATTVAFTFNNSRWSLGGATRVAEVTTSATTGTQYLPIINDPTIEVDAPFDASNLPFASGQAMSKVWLGFGGSGSGQRVSLTTLEDTSYVNDNTNDAVRVVMRFRGGFITDAVTN